MRIQSAVASRLPFYDRNPSAFIAGLTSSSLNITPIGSQNLVTYTVPSLRRAMLSHVSHNIRRRTAAAPVGPYFLETVSGGGLYGTRSGNNVVDNVERAQFACQDTAPAGTVFLVREGDASTGGTLDFYFGGTVTEYDA